MREFLLDVAMSLCYFVHDLRYCCMKSMKEGALDFLVTLEAFLLDPVVKGFVVETCDGSVFRWGSAVVSGAAEKNLPVSGFLWGVGLGCFFLTVLVASITAVVCSLLVFSLSTFVTLLLFEGWFLVVFELFRREEGIHSCRH